MPKNGELLQILKRCCLKRTKIGEKWQNFKIQMRHLEKGNFLMRNQNFQTPGKRANVLFWTIKHVQAGTLVTFPTKRILHLFLPSSIPLISTGEKFRLCSRGVTVREQLVNPWHTSTSLDMGCLSDAALPRCSVPFCAMPITLGLGVERVELVSWIPAALMVPFSQLHP